MPEKTLFFTIINCKEEFVYGSNKKQAAMSLAFRLGIPVYPNQLKEVLPIRFFKVYKSLGNSYSYYFVAARDTKEVIKILSKKFGKVSRENDWGLTGEFRPIINNYKEGDIIPSFNIE